MSLTAFRDAHSNFSEQTALQGDSGYLPHARLYQSFLYHALPPGWSRRALKVDDVSYPCYYAPATNAHTIIGLCTGFKSAPLLLLPEIQSLNKQGFSVVGIGLPYPEKAEDFLSAYENILEAFYFDESSPLYRAVRPDLPRVALTHSTSGLLFQGLMQEPQHAHIAEKNLAGAIHVAPFFDAANASRLFNPRLSIIYQMYAHWHHKDHLGTPILDRGYTWLQGMRNSLEDHTMLTPPTHGQAQVLSRYGKTVEEMVRMNEASGETSTLPQSFILGARDKCACSRTSEHVARHLGAAVITLQAGHNPMAEIEQGLTHVADTARTMGQSDRLRRLGLADQRLTGDLDTFTSLG